MNALAFSLIDTAPTDSRWDAYTLAHAKARRAYADYYRALAAAERLRPFGAESIAHVVAAHEASAATWDRMADEAEAEMNLPSGELSPLPVVAVPNGPEVGCG